jgi:hypothetical protein
MVEASSQTAHSVATSTFLQLLAEQAALVRLFRRGKSTSDQPLCLSGRADSNRRPLDPQGWDGRFKAAGHGFDSAKPLVGDFYRLPLLLLSGTSSRPSFNICSTRNTSMLCLPGPRRSVAGRQTVIAISNQVGINLRLRRIARRGVRFCSSGHSPEDLIAAAHTIAAGDSLLSRRSPAK